MTRRTSTILRIVLILAALFGTYWLAGVETLASLFQSGGPERLYWRLGRLVIIALLIIIIIFRLTKPRA